MDADEAREPTPEIRRRREAWIYRGSTRPVFAIAPQPGQESVWDYPRPPRLERDFRRIVVSHQGRILAQTSRSLRLLETAGPPTFYLPRADVQMDLLEPNASRSICEWKGLAVGFDLRAGPRDVAWSYPCPFPEYEDLAGWLAFYPGRVECFVADERVRAQPGGYYGGWITQEIVGPFKGEAIADGC